MPRFPVVVFDLDGVLADSSACHALAYRELWSRVGVEGPPYPTIAGLCTRDSVARVTEALRPSAETLAAWVRFKQERAREYLLTTILGFPDAEPMVRALARQGVQLAIGTSASRATATLMLDRSGLTPYFPVVVTADDVALSKPAPDTHAAAIARRRGHATEALVIEDSISGLSAGDAAGAFTAGVRSGARIESGRFLGSFPDLVALRAAVLED